MDKKERARETNLKGFQQEAAVVHTCLPPLVSGDVRGYVKVCLEGPVKWKCPVRPPAPKLSIRLRWWGEKGPGTLFRVSVEGERGRRCGRAGPNAAQYPIQAGLPQFGAYLKDMGALVFDVGLGHMTDSSMVIGRATVPDLVPLLTSGHISGGYSIFSSGDVLLGQLAVTFTLQVKKEQTSKQTKKKKQSNFIQDKVEPATRFKQEEEQKTSMSPKPTIIVSPSVNISGGAGRVMQPVPMMEEKRLQGATHPVSTSSEDVSVPVLGQHQREIISELLEKGTKLREQMVGSLAMGTLHLHNPLRAEGELTKELGSPGRLSLMSAELALKEGPGVTGGDLLYNELSSSDDGGQSGLSSGSISPEPLLQWLDEGPTTSPQPKTSTSNQVQSGSKSLLGAKEQASLQRRRKEREQQSSKEKLSPQSTLQGTKEQESTQRTSEYAFLHRSKGHASLENAAALPASKISDSQSKFALTRKLSERKHSRPMSAQQRLVQSDSTKSSHQQQVPKNGLSQQGSRSPVQDTVMMSGGEGSAVQSAEEGSEVQEREENENESSQHSEEEQEIHMSRGRIASASLRDLLAQFGQSQVPSEQEISRSMGVEQLTRLGRATSARVIVDTLSLDPSAMETILSSKYRQVEGKGPAPGLKATYFVEYQFPAALLDTKHSRRQHHLHEIMRIACKKMKSGEVVFNHRSVFPVLPNSKVVQSWWNSSLIFRVYCRPPQARMPLLVGKAVAPLRAWLLSPSLQFLSSLPVQSASMAEALHAACTTQPCIGQLRVCMQLLIGKQVFPALETTPPQERPGSPSHPHQPIKLKEVGPASASTDPDGCPSQSTSLQLLLLVPEAVGVKRPTSKPEAIPAPPNCYLICKLPVGQPPHPKTPIQWTTDNPHFLFRQLFPLHWSKSLVEKFCNNFCVVEVWHHDTDDQLLGLVKLSLHQFYLDFCVPSFACLSQQSQLPTVAVESYCPIVDPISGHTTGHLGVLLALGSPDQISYLLRQHASGQYPLQQPYISPQPSHTNFTAPPLTCKTCTGAVSQDRPEPRTPPTSLVHEFRVRVEGVQELKVPSKTVWGEADCFIQYHFPAPPDNCDDERALSFFPYRTPSTLYMPNPSFAHTTLHSLSLPVDCPVGQALVSASAHGMSGHIPFELWRRFYIPNIRDQLLAKAELPLMKVCALIVGSGGGQSATSSQTFSLPLTSVPPPAKEVGVLDVTLSYRESSHRTAVAPPVSTMPITVSLGLVRLAGLKRAAVLAARDHPLPLDFAAEAGVNPYVKMSTAYMMQEPCITKTMAKCFAAEFSQFFDVSVEFCPEGGEGCGHGGEGCGHAVTVSEMLQASLLVEVWHQVPRRVATAAPQALAAGHGFAAGHGPTRKLGPSFHDILLGVAHVPLRGLLTNTGVHGWYPLLPPATPHSPAVSGHTPAGADHAPLPVECHYVGGVEVCIGVKERELVVAAAETLGWKPPKLECRRKGEESGGGAWMCEVELSVATVVVESKRLLSAHSKNNKYCFLRYRFFDLDPISSTPRPPWDSPAPQGQLYYSLQHQACFVIPFSIHLDWYLSEEVLEIEVWGSSVAESTRPTAGDVLLGSVYVLLSELLSGPREIVGWYPFFKPGSADFGQQALHLQLRLKVSSGEGREGGVKLLDSDHCTASLSTASSPLAPASSPAPAPASPPGSKQQEQQSQPPMATPAQDAVFEATVVVHEALHLPLLAGEACPSAYVTMHPHPNVDRVSTAVIPSTQGPTWNYHCTTLIPTLHLQPQGPGLEFQVWSAAGSGAGEDTCIGCVSVDLSPLTFGLAQLSGWYNIVDFGGAVQGQLKVSIIPKERKSFPRPTFLPATHSQSSVVGSGGSTSLLFQQLRDNMKDLEQIHLSLQAKLNTQAKFSAMDTDPAPQTGLQANLSAVGPAPQTGLLAKLDTDLSGLQANLSTENREAIILPGSDDGDVEVDAVEHQQVVHDVCTLPVQSALTLVSQQEGELTFTSDPLSSGSEEQQEMEDLAPHVADSVPSQHQPQGNDFMDTQYQDTEHQDTQHQDIAIEDENSGLSTEPSPAPSPESQDARIQNEPLAQDRSQSVVQDSVESVAVNLESKRGSAHVQTALPQLQRAPLFTIPELSPPHPDLHLPPSQPHPPRPYHSEPNLPPSQPRPSRPYNSEPSFSHPYHSKSRLPQPECLLPPPPPQLPHHQQCEPHLPPTPHSQPQHKPHLPEHHSEPRLPNFFLSPEQLEQRMRHLRAAALAKVLPPTSLPPALSQDKESDQTGAAQRPYRHRSQAETERIARIFSSKPC